MEIWKQIDGWPLYDISSHGRVRSWNRSGFGCGKRSATAKLLSLRPNRGYARVTLCDLGKQCERFVHQLVLEHFVGPRPSTAHEGRHLDGDCSNNTASNLEWATHAVNMRDQYVHGTRARGTTHGMAKLSEADVLFIRNSTDELLPLAIKFGVSKSSVCRIRRGQKWAHLTTHRRSAADESQQSEKQAVER